MCMEGSEVLLAKVNNDNIMCTENLPNVCVGAHVTDHDFVKKEDCSHCTTLFECLHYWAFIDSLV